MRVDRHRKPSLFLALTELNGYVRRNEICYLMLCISPNESHSSACLSSGGSRLGFVWSTSLHVRILLVDDTPDVRDLFARVLRLHGCDVFAVADGQEALNAAVGFAPDLILTDLMMPAMDGVELIRQLRVIPELASVPAVVVTATSTAEAEKRARDVGAVDFITKPINVGKLLGSLENYQSATGR